MPDRFSKVRSRTSLKIASFGRLVVASLAFSVAAGFLPSSQSQAKAEPLTSTEATLGFDFFTTPNTFFNFNSPASSAGINYQTNNPTGNFLVITPNNDFTTGSNFLLTDYIGDIEAETITFTPNRQGEVISLLSIDIIEFANLENLDLIGEANRDRVTGDGSAFTFVGTTLDGQVVTESVMTEGDLDYLAAATDYPGNDGTPETYNLNALARGVFTEISITYPTTGIIGIDNIVFGEPIPEPSSAVCMGLLAACAATRRRVV